jgi:ATP synthase protein I
MRRRLRHLPATLLASLVLLVVAVPIGALVRSGAGAAGAASGVGLVVASYLLSALAVAWADTIDPRMVMPVGLTTYLVKVLLLGVAMAALASTGWPGLGPMAVALIAAVLVWTTTQAWWTWRARLPYVDLSEVRE